MNKSEINAYLLEEVEKETFPGYVYLVANNKRIVESGYGGCRSLIPVKRRMQKNTIFDLASLTKPLVTASVVLKLCEANLINLNCAIETYIPELRKTEKGCIKIRELLVHSSGLMGWYPLFIRAHSLKDAAGIIYDMPLRNYPGTKVEYSCIGYILLTWIVTTITGENMIELYEKMIRSRLKLASVFFHSCKKRRTRVAATEYGSQYEKTLAENMNLTFDRWRTYVMQGEVHDSNCYFLGGASGNSGMFSDIFDLYESALKYLEGTDLFSSESLALFYKNETPFDAEHRTIGWQLATSSNCGGRSLSPQAIGHSGFTGTSLWIEPDKKNVYILLTNRIHPHVTDIVMNEIRDKFHRLSLQMTT